MLLIGMCMLAGLVLNVASLTLFLAAAALSVYTLAALGLCVISSLLFLYVASRCRDLDAEIVKNILLIGMEAQAEKDRLINSFISEQTEGTISPRHEGAKDGGSRDAAEEYSADKALLGGTYHEIRF